MKPYILVVSAIVEIVLGGPSSSFELPPGMDDDYKVGTQETRGQDNKAVLCYGAALSLRCPI